MSLIEIRQRLDGAIQNNFKTVLQLLNNYDISQSNRNQALEKVSWNEIVREVMKSLPATCKVYFTCEAIMSTLSLSITVAVDEAFPLASYCAFSYPYTTMLDILIRYVFCSRLPHSHAQDTIHKFS